MKRMLLSSCGAATAFMGHLPGRIFRGLSPQKALLTVAAAAALLGTPARAADMEVKAPAAPVYSWTEFYFGGNIGWAQGTSSWCTTETFGAPAIACSTNPYNESPTGTIAGGQFGYRWQSPSNFVIGADITVDAYNLMQNQVSKALPATETLSMTLTNPQTADIELGYAFGRVLVYGKGGYAATEAEFDALNATVIPGLSLSHVSWLNGWNVGGGVEYMLFSHLSLGVEYNYYQFSTSNITNQADNTGTVVSCAFCSFGTTSAQSVTARLNIKLWPWGP